MPTSAAVFFEKAARKPSPERTQTVRPKREAKAPAVTRLQDLAVRNDEDWVLVSRCPKKDGMTTKQIVDSLVEDGHDDWELI